MDLHRPHRRKGAGDVDRRVEIVDAVDATVLDVRVGYVEVRAVEHGDPRHSEGNRAVREPAGCRSGARWIEVLVGDEIQPIPVAGSGRPAGDDWRLPGRAADR